MDKFSSDHDARELKRTNAELRFTVSGQGPFPLDMLRYDSCFPVSGSDAANMGPHSYDFSRDVTQISHTRQRPTSDRWRSFGWVGTDEESREHTLDDAR